jgi:hypothetical protein
MLRLGLCACLACLVAGQGIASADPIIYAATDTGRFGTLNVATGVFTPIGGVHVGGYDGLGNLPNGNFAAVDGFNNFVTINRTTGAVTTVGPTGVPIVVNASLTTGAQFALDSFNRLYQINPNTGADSARRRHPHQREKGNGARPFAFRCSWKIEEQSSRLSLPSVPPRAKVHFLASSLPKG